MAYSFSGTFSKLRQEDLGMLYPLFPVGKKEFKDALPNKFTKSYFNELTCIYKSALPLWLKEDKL